MQWRNVEKKEERGDRGALGGSDVDWGLDPWGSLENQGAASLTKKGRNPGNQIGGNAALPQDSGQSLLSTLSNPAFISTNREETLRRGLCRVLMSLVRVRHAS